MTLEHHPASTLFPLMDGADLAALVDDVRAHGLLEPIVTYEGMVLDGRNRLRACELAGVEPQIVEWSPDGMSPTEWVVSMNLHRRHLTTAQRAALALDLLPRLEEEARGRQSEAGGANPGPLTPETEEAKGEAAEKAAELVGVGRTTVAGAKAIQKRDETGEVVDQMRAGDINIEQAKRAVGFKPGPQREGEGVLPSVHETSTGRTRSAVLYGKGDKWIEATEPLRRYLAAWEKKGYEFRHVNPREARKRIQAIDTLIAGLTSARADLATRSEVARMTV